MASTRIPTGQVESKRLCTPANTAITLPPDSRETAKWFADALLCSFSISEWCYSLCLKTWRPDRQ